MKKALSLFFIAALFYPAVVFPKEATILFTGNLRGELNPCGCSEKTDFGGIGRRGTKISSYKNPILIDAGNFSDEDSPQGRIKTRYQLMTFPMMNYDAVSFGERERPFFMDAMIYLKKHGIKIVSGDPFTLKRFPEIMFFNINDASKLKRDGKHPKKGVIYVGIGSIKYGKLKNLLLFNKWINFAIVSGTGENIEGERVIAKTTVLEGFDRGQRLGVLSIKIANGRVLEKKVEFVPLGKEIPDRPDLKNLLSEYDREIAEYYEKSIESAKVKNGYSGAESCLKCHENYFSHWKTTRHSKAWETLEKAGKTKDPECIRCHTVGFGTEGGFISEKLTPQLTSVQCEVCHGKGTEHLADIQKPIEKVSVKICAKCHVKEHSPDFEYESYKKKIENNIF